MKNEKGITLIELLAAVVIAGIVIVPLLTIMTGTFTRTISQEKETEIAYVAQEIMEKIRLNSSNMSETTDPDYVIEEKFYCYPISNPEISCDEELPLGYQPSTGYPSSNYITIEIIEHPNYPDFSKVTVSVIEDTKIVNGGEESNVVDKENRIDLVTVVDLQNEK